METNNSWNKIRSILQEGGTRFDYLFDCLTGVEVAVTKDDDDNYLEEKLENLKRSVEFIIWDVHAWKNRQKHKEVITDGTRA